MSNPPNKATDLIAAIATPPGHGGIGIVRLSGPGIDTLEQKLLDKPAVVEKACRRTFLDRDKDPIDDGIALRFVAPASFTGEDVLELQGHGGPAVMHRLLQRCLELGARIADPGEFSLRAFSNGKIDLAQAEGIADLIGATSEKAAKLAAASMRGELGRLAERLAGELVEIRALLEANIDFSDEDIDHSDYRKMTAKLEQALADTDDLIGECRRGSVFQEGLTVALVGAPNAGKSSLLNLLSRRDAAIVADEPGTTRDVVAASCEVQGVVLRFLDTAGLREGGSDIEREGMRRTRLAQEEADLTVLVVDATSNEQIEAAADLTVHNKIDLTGDKARAENGVIYMSAKTGAGLDLLTDALVRRGGLTDEEPRFLARERHMQALQDAREEMSQASETCEQAPEQAAEHLRLAHDRLGAITGRVTADDLLGEIFSRFCIGK